MTAAAALWRLLATHEELTVLETTIMLGTPSGACFDPDRLERDVQRPLAGVADTIAQQARTLQLDPAAIQTTYERLVQLNAEWLVFRAQIDADGVGPERMAGAQKLVAAWNSDITVRFGDVVRSLRELVLLTAGSAVELPVSRPASDRSGVRLGDRSETGKIRSKRPGPPAGGGSRI